MDDLRYWVGFNRVAGIGPARLRALLDHFGDIGRAWEATPAEWREIGLDRRSIQNLLTARQELDLDREAQRVEDAELLALT